MKRPSNWYEMTYDQQRAWERQEQRDELLSALSNLVDAVAADQLMPESVSFMRDARAAIAKAKGQQTVSPACGES